MAVTKTLTNAVPFNLNNKVQEWDLTMQYKQGNKSADPPTYFETSYNALIPSSQVSPKTGETIINFTPKAEASWTKAEIVALLPTAQWDTIFASQYDSVITNPPDLPVADNSYVIPDSS